MKNNKIAKIAAVTVLAVAPITATIASVDTVQASLLGDIFGNNDATSDQLANVTNAINGLTDQTYNENNAMPSTAEFAGIEGLSENGRGISPVQFSAEIVSINSGLGDAAQSALAVSNVQKLKVYVSANDLKAQVNKAAEKGNGNSFSFTVTLKNGENILATKKLTYTNNTKVATDDAPSVTTPTNSLSNVTDLTGYHTVDLGGQKDFVYALFSLAGKKSNRGLAGNTSWYTDKTATDANGNTYYRVSTDEWVEQASGVTFN